MMTASAGTTHCKKMKLYIIFEFLNFSDLFSTPIGLKPCSGYTCTDNVQFHTKVPKLTQCGSRSPKYIHLPFPTSFPGSLILPPTGASQGTVRWEIPGTRLQEILLNQIVFHRTVIYLSKHMQWFCRSKFAWNCFVLALLVHNYFVF